MPRLPSAQDINRQTPSFDRQVVALPQDPMGKVLQQAGGQLQQTGTSLERQAYKMQLHEERVLEQERQKVNVVQKAQAQTSFLQDLNDWQTQAMNDTDYSTQPKRFSDFAQQSLQKYSSGITDTQERELFELKAKQDISNYGVRLNSNAYEMRNKQLVAGHDESLNRTINQISAAGDTLSKQRLIQAKLEETRALVAAGVLPPSAAVTAKETMRNTWAYSELDSKNPQELLNTFDGKPNVDVRTTGNQVLDETIETVSAQTGVPRDFLVRTAQIESGGKVNAKNPNSTAAGAFQLLEGTAKTLGVNPYDVKQATMGAAGLYLENRARFEKELGRQPTDAEMYIMHQQGAPSAMSLFKAASNGESALDALTRLHDADIAQDMIVNNGGNLDMTAGEFVKKWDDKYNGTADKSLLDYVTPAQQRQLYDGAVRKVEQQQKAALEAEQNQILLDTVSNAIKGDGYINPKDTKQMKMFDDVYNSQVLNNPDISLEEKTMATAEIVKNVGVIPNALKGRMQQVFRLSTDANEIAQYADIYAKLEEQSPQVLNDMPPESKVLASYISEGRRAGIDLSDRVASMRDSLKVENKPMVEKRKELLKDDKMKNSIDNNINELFDTWIPFAGQEIDTGTGVNQLVVSDYKTAFEQSYLMTEDSDAAHKYAESVVKGQYSPSVFADGGVMKHAPEMYYSIPNDDGKWMQEELLNDVNSFYGNQKLPNAESDAVNREIDFMQSKLPATFDETEKRLLEEKIVSLQESIPKGIPFTENQVRIMADSRTMREAVATKKPSYAIIVTTYPNGYPKVEALKGRFIPNVEKRLLGRIEEAKNKEAQNKSDSTLRASSKTGIVQ